MGAIARTGESLLHAVASRVDEPCTSESTIEIEQVQQNVAFASVVDNDP